ncbi:hypothetical protein [Streptomyces sp. G-G2]|uniref:hypothetical protein n=1 Tax=Streptomyces sp. G-G2 TaxID=3046201 RepID=UPI0024B8C88A|nr:hypothetical protein [Streptomyces sp. G-G2]MDJ0380594.1 hypothetical protein [Streptomyces sp. G-G2]
MAWLPAVLTLVAALAVGYWALRARPGLVTGRDGRLSTSKTLATAWTGLLLWMLLVLLVYGLTQGIGWFRGPRDPFQSLTSVYLPLLGGPYLALIGAKGVVGVRVQNGHLFKPEKKPEPGAPPAGAPQKLPMNELIANDSGQTDLMDLQYVAFSVVTMLYVAAFFVADVGAGLPKLPTGIWALTGAPAGVYLVNKLATRPNPVITRVTREGGLLRVEGGGFGPDATHGKAQVSIDGETRPDAELGPDGALTLPLPVPVTTPGTPVTVHVTARGLRSDPYVYRPAATVVAQRPAPEPAPRLDLDLDLAPAPAPADGSHSAAPPAPGPGDRPVARP